jgi:hypothetical protein
MRMSCNESNFGVVLVRAWLLIVEVMEEIEHEVWQSGGLIV